MCVNSDYMVSDVTKSVAGTNNCGIQTSLCSTCLKSNVSIISLHNLLQFNNMVHYRMTLSINKTSVNQPN